MLSDDRRRVLVFNGEIYNFKQLRRELESDCEFRSNSDGEVILHGYRRWGLRGLLDRLDGMFAFALWDEDPPDCFSPRGAAREKKKPFFFRHQGRSLHFASTLNALLDLLPALPPLDPHAIDAFLVYQAVPAPMSVFHGVAQLLPAHFMAFSSDTGGCEIERYWDVSYATKTRESEAEVLEHVESLARDAVRKRLESDVPVGVFLSGGVDSSLIAGLAARESSETHRGR